MNQLKTRFLSSAAILVVSATAAHASNVTGANANVLNLLSPFLTLNSAAAGMTLQDALNATVNANNNATPVLQELAISDENILGSASNTVTGLSGVYGVAANLAGGLPNQPAPGGGTVPGVQPYGGYGQTLGAIYAAGVNAYAAASSSAQQSSPLYGTVQLLTTAYTSLTKTDANIAKFYFANGTTNGTTKASAPSGYTLPTEDGLPSTTASVYDTAFGVNTGQPNQSIYGNSRPFQVLPPGNTSVSSPPSIVLYDPTLTPASQSGSPSFPSGHSTYAYTDSILLGMLTPELYQSMLVRASQYANSRLVLGVHYATDVIGSRSLATYELAQALSNPSYINNATTTGTAFNLPQLFTAAAPGLNTYLSAGCGASVATCAATQANSYAPSSANATYYANNLTYGLPTSDVAGEQAPSGASDASILLATVYGGSTAAAKALAPNGGAYGSLSTATINQIIVNTETEQITAFANTSLSYWSRLNLYAAIGYFGGVTGTLTTANGDVVSTNVTIQGPSLDNLGNPVASGDLEAKGLLTIDGNLTVYNGTLGFTIAGLTAQTEYSQILVSGETEIGGGQIGVTLGDGFAFEKGQSFDLVDSAGGLTLAETGVGLAVDGTACASLGHDFFGCDLDGRTTTFELLAVDPSGATDLDLNVVATPEPATWAMMLAGFGGLGFAAWRRAKRATA